MSEPAHNRWPERFEKIVTDDTVGYKKVLTQISREVDMQVPDQVAKARRIIRELDDLLVIERDDRNQLIYDELLGYGLSAVQLKSQTDNGVVPLRIGAIRVPKLTKDHKPLELDMINPQIIQLSRPFKYKDEGCLSFPGKYVSTSRFRVCKVGFIDAMTLEPREIQVYGFEAVVIQHEVDHHDGKLFTEHQRNPVVKDAKVKPNEPCPCGSEKKFKKCCMYKDEI